MRFQMIIVTVAVCVFGAGVPAAEAASSRDCDSCRVACPHCSSSCTPVVRKEDKTKHCWGIQCKTICIPRVTFPWQKKSKSCGCDFHSGSDSCCDCPRPKCGRTKRVRKLMKHEYKCPVCKYTFELENACDTGSCDPCTSDAPAPRASVDTGTSTGDGKTARATDPALAERHATRVSRHLSSK